MDRRERLKKAADQVESGLFCVQCQRLEREYQDSRPRSLAVGAFAHLMELAAEQNKETVWLGICVLETSLATGSHETLLSLYNQDFYFDAAPVEAYWCPPGFKECFEEDMETVMKRLRTQFPRIWNYEEDAVRRRCAEYYQAALCQLCRDLGEEIMGTAAFHDMRKGERFTAFFGHYRGEGEILWHTGEALSISG